MDAPKKRPLNRLEWLVIAGLLFTVGSCVAMFIGREWASAYNGVGAAGAAIVACLYFVNRRTNRRPPDPP